MLNVHLDPRQGERSMMKTDLAEIYRNYIACLNR